MGSLLFAGGSDEDEELHQVTISKDFFLGTYEVTQAQYEQVMGSNPSYYQGDKVKGDSSRHPVECVSWEDAVEFCKRLSDLPEERQAGRVYRLPTEAEWEYACRAGSKTAFSFGDESGSLGDFAWFYDNSGRKTHPVGKKKPNAWGLYDMHGNVWEWTSDWFSADYFRESPVDDPQGPATGTHHTLRGGSASVEAHECRCAIRGEAGAVDGWKLPRAINILCTATLASASYASKLLPLTKGVEQHGQKIREENLATTTGPTCIQGNKSSALIAVTIGSAEASKAAQGKDGGQPDACRDAARVSERQGQGLPTRIHHRTRCRSREAPPRGICMRDFSVVGASAGRSGRHAFCKTTGHQRDIDRT
jgi:hypothetical protein